MKNAPGHRARVTATPAHSGKEQTVSGVGAIPRAEAFGVPSAYEPAQEEWLIEGCLDAIYRYRTASQRGSDPDAKRATFIPLFEALAFAASLIESVLEPKPEDKTIQQSPSFLQGVRYVRNRVQHQWAVALRGGDVPLPPATLRLGGRSQRIQPTVVYEWFWKPLAELPKPPTGFAKDELGQKSYHRHLAEQPARFTLDAIEQILKQRL